MLSVIVPVYNCEKYLAECLDSIIAQTYTDIEIICVNDGSKDSSLDILNQYAQKDSRIIIVNKENGGLSSARNAGLKEAKGEYVAFVDGDDVLAPETYEQALQDIENVDVVCFGIKVFGVGCADRRQVDNEYYKIKFSGIVDVSKSVLFSTDVSSCNKLFKMDIIKKYKITYPEGLRYEDACFYWKYMSFVKKIKYINKYFYFYRRHNESIMANTFKGSEYAIDHLRVISNLQIFLEKNNIFQKDNEIFYQIYKNFLDFAFVFSTENKKKSVLKLAKDYAKKYFQNTDAIEVIKSYEKVYRQMKMKSIKQILKQIFSVSNDGNCTHKVVRILGLKFKVRYVSKKLTSLQALVMHQQDLIYENTQLIQQLYKKANDVNTDLEYAFSNYAVMSGGGHENLKYLFEQMDYLQDYYNIEQTPKSAFVWGSASWSPQADTIIYAMNQNIPLYKFEDGFLRSADTWCNTVVDKKYTTGISFTVTDSVHYFDATRPSRMEQLLNDKFLVITDEQKQRARACIDRIVETHLTKYNHQPIFEPKIGRDSVKKVLVIDQSFGDFSISRGLASENTFKKMLEAAIRENPDADIIVKTHPDTIAKGSSRKTGYYSDLVAHDNVYTQTEAINPISLIKYVDKVYVCTTQFGFESLMCGKEVHVFGMPFYAGWGLTHDRQKCERRTNTRTLEEVFYIAYIMYSYYVNPERQCRCEIEEAMDYLLKLRDEYFALNNK